MQQMETSRLILRPWLESDAEDLYRYAKDPAVGTAADWPPHKSVEESREIIRTVFSFPDTYAVVLKSTGEAVGCVGIVPDEAVHSKLIRGGGIEVGYWIGKPYWGRGLAPEALFRLLEHCFEDLGVSVVWGSCFEENIQSARVMEKCGFCFHHTEVDNLSGSGRTVTFMKLNAEEWREQDKRHKE